MGQVTTKQKPNKTGKSKDFWVVHSSDKSNSLVDVLHALYYLPENYRLIVVSDDMQKDVMCTMGHFGLKKRIKLTPKSEMSEKTSPFLIADAVISTNSGDTADKPSVRISEKANAGLEGDHKQGFTVSPGNPTAIASAIFSIARANA